MSTWTYEALQKAIDQTKPIDPSDGETTRNLYEVVSAKGEIDEASFHDAVSRNLKRGRFLLIIVGDGMREGVESIAQFLQQYASFHFTLTLVELAVFEVEKGKTYIPQPRVLAKTINIERAIVTLKDGQIAIQPPTTEQIVDSSGGRRSTITQERYFETLEKRFPDISTRLSAFIDSLADCNVVPEYGTDCLILRWRPDNGKSWNFASITSKGDVWMDLLCHQAKVAGLLEDHKRYLRTLATLIPGAYVRETPKDAGWYVARGDKPQFISIYELVEDQARRDGWVGAIKAFQAAVMPESQDD